MSEAAQRPTRPKMRSFTTSTFLASVLASNIGRYSYFMSATWFALLETNSVQTVTLLLLSGTMIEFLTSGAVGFIADSVDRPLVCVAYDAMRIVVLLMTAILFAYGWGAATLFGSMILYSAADRGYLAAAQAMVPSIAPEGALVAMNSWSYLMMQAGNFIGAVATGWSLHTFTPSKIFGAMSLCFLTSAAAMLFLRTRSCMETAVRAPAMARLTDVSSIACVFKSPALIVSTAAYSLIVCMGTLFSLLLSAYVVKELGRSSFVFGLLERPAGRLVRSSRAFSLSPVILST
ncbi:hypothetical protein [Mesorhizobium sp.]|uniref:hypothetical protein n=1 Tax=Mesorhizobium sp. TaxID=1871066 RepID=UPI000FE74805|nr:hypothetical protein [Mesorhizobium sp.]RWP52828.1 MAG: hypothetical protein EOR06_18330 [Mesorhizobium sp.]RWP75554.1 MAG: hypothetical protein EOR10_19795 [Mesorhizobium sp.]